MAQKVLSKNGKMLTANGKALTANLGITPTGSTTITANGTYDVADKAQAIVNVPSSGGAELTAIEVYVADLTDTTSYTIAKGAVDGYKRKITA